MRGVAWGGNAETRGQDLAVCDIRLEAFTARECEVCEIRSDLFCLVQSLTVSAHTADSDGC